MRSVLLLLCLLFCSPLYSAPTTDTTTLGSMVTITPTITAGAYVAGNQVGGIQTITALAPNESDSQATLLNVTVLDKDSQNAALTIFFFSDLPVLASVDHAALNISDIEMTKCIGWVTIAGANYQTTASNSVGIAGSGSFGLFLSLKSLSVLPTGRPTGNIYAVVKTTGTPTYTSTSALQFRYAVWQ